MAYWAAFFICDASYNHQLWIVQKEPAYKTVQQGFSTGNPHERYGGPPGANMI